MDVAEGGMDNTREAAQIKPVEAPSAFPCAFHCLSMSFLVVSVPADVLTCGFTACRCLRLELRRLAEGGRGLGWRSFRWRRKLQCHAQLKK